MALFRRNKTNTTIPELQEYYASQRRESTGLAWLLAIGSLLVTAAVIVGLFVGGRWLYRKATNKNKPATTASTTSTNKNPASGSTSGTGTTAPTPSTSSNTPGNSSATNTSGSNTTSGTASGTGSSAPGVAPTQSPATNSSASAASTTTPSTPAPTEVPNTGPGNVIALFIAITAMTYFANRARLLRKNRA